jgi:integrase
MAYLQLWHGKYRVRRPVPKALQQQLNRGQYLTRSLGTADPDVAEKLSFAVNAEFQAMLDDAHGRVERQERGAAAYAELCTLEGWSLTDLISKHYEAAAIMQEFLATVPGALPMPAANSEQPSKEAVPFLNLIDDWALFNPEPRAKRPLVLHLGRFAEFLGHEDMRRVKDTDLVAFEEKLLEHRMNPGTVQNHLKSVHTLCNFAAERKRINVSPALGVKIRAQRKTRNKPIGFSENEARTILLASRDMEPAIKWLHWLGCWSGARAAEIIDAHTNDFVWRNGLLVFSVSEDNRDLNQTIKTEVSSVRELPLVTAVIDEGFVDFLNAQPRGPLFAYVKPNRDGRRSNTIIDKNGRWIRKTLKITDRRIRPHHSWRHRITTWFRDLGIRQDVSYSITGHGKRPDHAGMTYGEWLKAQYDAMSKLPHPLGESQRRWG